MSLSHPKKDVRRKYRVAGPEIEPVMMDGNEFGAEHTPQSRGKSREIELEFDFVGQDLDTTSQSEFAPLEATPNQQKSTRIDGPEIEPVMAEQGEFPDDIPEHSIMNLERHAELEENIEASDNNGNDREQDAEQDALQANRVDSAARAETPELEFAVAEMDNVPVVEIAQQQLPEDDTQVNVHYESTDNADAANGDST
jgi:hypothetical protein